MKYNKNPDILLFLLIFTKSRREKKEKKKEKEKEKTFLVNAGAQKSEKQRVL